MPSDGLVFIIDRDQAVRDSLRFSIELDGMEVRTCDSGKELQAHPDISKGSCAIIDGGTLHRDGPEVAAKLQADYPVLPVVLITDHVSRRLLAHSAGVARFHFVEKPVLDDTLIRCVRAVRRA